MKRGLVLGKFMPLHKGQINLINFADQHCDELIALVCAANSEPIPGEMRIRWIRETFKQDAVIPILFTQDDSVFPNTSLSSQEVSKIWANVVLTRLPVIDRVFSSEKYGDYLAEFMNCMEQNLPENYTRNP